MGGLTGWSRLSLEDAQNASRASAFLGANLQGSIHAIYEALAGSPPLGSQRQLIHPHDHGKHGGIPLPRGSHWTFDSGFDHEAWIIHASDPGIPFWRDRTGQNRSNFQEGDANFLMDVPFGLDSETTNFAGAASSFEARVWAYALPAGGSEWLDFSFYNRTTGQFSESQRILLGVFGSVQQLNFLGVPIRSGQRNELILACTAENVGQGRILSVNICSTRERSQPRFVPGTFSLPAVGRP